MGCVWQTPGAPEQGAGVPLARHRGAARHRKPPAWRRPSRELALTGAEPARPWGRLDWAWLVPLARWR